MAAWTAGAAMQPALAQQAFTWDQIRDKFVATNPTLQAARIGIDESRAQEITAFLRPNPDISLTTDGFQVTPNNGIWRPLSGVLETPGVSYLHERRHKRELRLESAQKGTTVAESQLADQQRTLLFNLRNAFVQVLQQKAVLALARENLAYYDQVLRVGRDRKQAGDIAQVDLDRLELQRVQYETDLETATVNLRTAKIQLLTLLNDRTPVQQFDVTGAYDFADQVAPLEEYRNMALEARPDLKAAMQAVEKAKTDHLLAIANGSADPTFSGWYSHNPSFANPFANNTIGGTVSIPLRIFDRNQGEKARTQLDIGRNERLQAATEAQVFSDVDSAYATVNSNLVLLRRYKETYLNQAVRVREVVSFSYQHGGASLLDFLQAQQDYRSVQLNYLNLIGAYLTAASQLNLAVGREVIR
ncbi:MAG TPA: TolC family protein [Bryobacteraceae bacterium]|nr:TolC family protein [Bryobacteraceae bacterium]